MDAKRAELLDGRAQLRAELLGVLQEIQVIVARGVVANTLEAFETALDDIADLACDEYDDEGEPDGSSR